ncbi:hypothetical protein K4G98_26515, partial [Mycobacterium tuberculosis]|nr:hypothetical protein [Mycobacterium tuberculosis]
MKGKEQIQGGHDQLMYPYNPNMFQPGMQQPYYPQNQGAYNPYQQQGMVAGVESPNYHEESSSYM